jgi:fructokinase
VVVTDGAAGAAGWTSRGSAAVRAPEVKVVDTVGAGDAFTAGFLAWLWGAASLGKEGVANLDDQALESALAYGAAAGAAQCTRASAWGPLPDDVSEALRRVKHQRGEALNRRMNGRDPIRRRHQDLRR